MRNDWRICNIGDVCEVYNGSTPLRSKKEYWENGTINWFTIDDIREQGRVINETIQKITPEGYENSSLNLLPKNTVMICCTASVGEYAITNVELTTNQQFNGLVVKDGIDLLPDYLFYFSSTLKQRLLSVSGKTTIDYVSMTKLRNVEIPIPPIPEQKRIVAILDEAFDAIDQARANIERNIENAEELFQSKLEKVFKQLSEQDKITYQLKNVCEYDKITNEKVGIPYVGLADIESDSGRFIGDLTPREMKSRTFYFNENHLLYGRLRPYLNKILIPDFEGHCSTEIFPIKTSNLISKSFLFYWFLKPTTVNKIDKTSTGARMPRANMDEVMNFEIPVPSIEVQKELVNQLVKIKEKSLELLQGYKHKKEQLEELKKSILQKAFSGELSANETVAA